MRQDNHCREKSLRRMLAKNGLISLIHLYNHLVLNILINTHPHGVCSCKISCYQGFRNSFKNNYIESHLRKEQRDYLLRTFSFCFLDDVIIRLLFDMH